MVPPHMDNKVTVAAPMNVASLLQDTYVGLLTADDDDYVFQADSAAQPLAPNQTLQFSRRRANGLGRQRRCATALPTSLRRRFGGRSTWAERSPVIRIWPRSS